MLDTVTAGSIQTQSNHVNYINFISYAILYYDFGLTFADEVERFWFTRSLSWASSFFYLNRYLAILGYIPVIIYHYLILNHSNVKVNCPSLASFHQYLAVAIQITVGILLTMRTYALYDRNKWVLLVICAVALGVVIFGCWSVSEGRNHSATVVLPETGCFFPTSRANAMRLAAAWTGNFVFGVLIFVLTVYKSVKRSRNRDRILLKILLRDGAIYFGIMAVTELATIISYYLSLEYDRGFITVFTNVISSTMISRLMLNLRDPKLILRYGGNRLENTTANPDTSYPILSTVLEFNTISEATTTVDRE